MASIRALPSATSSAESTPRNSRQPFRSNRYSSRSLGTSALGQATKGGAMLWSWNRSGIAGPPSDPRPVQPDGGGPREVAAAARAGGERVVGLVEAGGGDQLAG